MIDHDLTVGTAGFANQTAGVIELVRDIAMKIDAGFFRNGSHYRFPVFYWCRCRGSHVFRWCRCRIGLAGWRCALWLWINIRGWQAVSVWIASGTDRCFPVILVVAMELVATNRQKWQLNIAAQLF